MLYEKISQKMNIINWKDRWIFLQIRFFCLSSFKVINHMTE